MHIQFLGATRQVTGSCHLLQINHHRILLDCGLIQGSQEQEQANADNFDFNPADIDTVILSHAHLDHSGRLPLLVKQGFKGQIICHHATFDLCKILLADAAYLNQRSTEWENRKRERKDLPLVTPLYNQHDAEQALLAFTGIDYLQTTEVQPGIRLTLHDAGHILGSSIIELDLVQGKQHKRLVYSGDLGHAGSPLHKNPSPLHQADLVIMESTYGDRLHRPWQDTWQEMGEIIKCARNDKGNILIPAFTVGRSQELLYVLGRHFDDWGLHNWQVFLDSPMAIDTTDVYRKYAEIYNRQVQRQQQNGNDPFDLPNLHMTPSTEESMVLNTIHSGAIIIAGSGMCTGGRIKQHLKHNLWRKYCHILFVGFQARGTPGRALVDGARQLQLWGETIKVNAKVHTLGGLSAHADQDGLIKWYSQFEQHPKLVLVHGEPQAQETLSQRISQSLSSDVIVAEYGQVVAI